MFEFTGNIGDTVVRTADLTRWKIVHREVYVLTMSPCDGDSANVITVDFDDVRALQAVRRRGLRIRAQAARVQEVRHDRAVLPVRRQQPSAYRTV